MSKRGILLLNANRNVHFTVRIDRKTLDKFGYVAKYNGRSKCAENLILMRKHITEFEKKHGEIVLEDDDRL